MDVMGIVFRRELYLSTRQVYPPLQDREKGVHTKTQARLLRKLGDNAYPFFFEVRVCLRQLGQADRGQTDVTAQLSAGGHARVVKVETTGNMLLR